MSQGPLRLAGTLAVIGGGRMGEAIIKGLLDAGAIDASDIVVAEPVEERRSELAEQYRVDVASDASAAAREGDIILLAVKPQVIDDVVGEIADSVGAALVVSIAAGITCDRLEALLGDGVPVVRVMPNTPAMVGEGMSVVSGGAWADAEQIELVRGAFGLMGRAIALPEEHQDLATAISGSGPAYAARFIDALATAGTEQGLPREIALELAVQTVHGTTHLLAESGIHPSELVVGVSSPGGTTVAALEELTTRDFDATIAAAVDRAVRRAKELGS